MKLESLDALIIDRSLGELPEEVCELLDAYLSGNPEAAEEAEFLRGAIKVTDRVVNKRADLFRETGESPRENVVVSPFSGRMRIAAVAASICLAGLAGFFLNSEQVSRSNDLRSPALIATSQNSPWAKYRIEDSTADTDMSLSVRVE